MARFRPEPPFAHDRVPRIGVLLVNLGTPDAPTPAAVRRYLAQFLSDPRVVEIPPAVWQPILHGVVLLTRPRKSAAKYEKIWTKDGSPLLVHSMKQRTLLRGYLGERLKAAGLPRPALLDRAFRHDRASFAYEALNLVNGSRTVQEIHDRLAVSIGSVPLSQVEDYLATLEKLGLLERA